MFPDVIEEMFLFDDCSLGLERVMNFPRQGAVMLILRKAMG